MEENQNIPNIDEQINETTNDNNVATSMKPYVIRNFKKELKRVKWPVEKNHNKNFLYIFIFIIFLTGFFALISFGATQLIELIGAK